MKNRIHAGASAFAVLSLTWSLVSPAWAAPTSSPAAKPKEAMVTNHASGPFDVKITPQAKGEEGGGSVFGRMTIDKQLHGDLEGTSQGLMMTAGTAVQGSAGYVALEQVTGSLKGKKGTFILQHSATMNRGTPQLSITVVPDSGTGELTGLAGKMDIVIAEGGKHSYDFEYTLPSS
jgi:hypothetical protein